MIVRVTLRMLFHLSGIPHLHVNRPLLSSSLKDISRENIFQVLKKILWTFSRYSSFFLLLRSHQASQQTNSGRVRDQPALPVPKVYHRIDHRICLDSSFFLEIDAILFAFNRISERKPKEHTRKLKAQEISCFV